MAEAPKTAFVCPGGGRQYGQVVQGVKLPTRNCVSAALAHSCVRVAFACGWCVGAALPHSCVSVPLAYGCVSVASAHSCVSANGIGVGCLFACGAREKKRDIWLRDKASAILFSLPGTCISASVKLLLAASRNRRRKRSAICGCFTDFLSQDFMMAWLSQQKQILLPRSHWAHAVVAARMANVSCHWMDRCGSRWCGCQSPRSQAPAK